MNRKQMLDFVNEKVLPGAQIDSADWLRNGQAITADIVRTIARWRVGRPADTRMEAEIRDGVLFINGETAGRVAARLPRVPFTEEGYQTEGRVLAKCGL